MQNIHDPKLSQQIKDLVNDGAQCDNCKYCIVPKDEKDPLICFYWTPGKKARQDGGPYICEHWGLYGHPEIIGEKFPFELAEKACPKCQGKKFAEVQVCTDKVHFVILKNGEKKYLEREYISVDEITHYVCSSCGEEVDSEYFAD